MTGHSPASATARPSLREETAAGGGGPPEAISPLFPGPHPCRVCGALPAPWGFGRALRRLADGTAEIRLPVFTCADHRPDGEAHLARQTGRAALDAPAGGPAPPDQRSLL